VGRGKWRQRTLPLKDGHGWKAEPGCKIFMAGRGAVRFDFPQEWVVKPADKDISIELFDKQPPDDDCRLAVSYLVLAPIDWSGLPVATLLESSAEVDTRPITTRGEVRVENRAGIDIAWREVRFVDPTEQREACSLTCMARKGRIQALITFDFWSSQRDARLKAWQTVLKSLRLDEYHIDPRWGRPLA